MYHKLHGDGQGDRCTIELPVNQGSTNKGSLPTTEAGKTVWYSSKCK